MLILSCISLTAYTIAKYGMSMCVLGMAEELKPVGIAVNGLWPRTGRSMLVNVWSVCMLFESLSREITLELPTTAWLLLFHEIVHYFEMFVFKFYVLKDNLTPPP